MNKHDYETIQRLREALKECLHHLTKPEWFILDEIALVNRVKDVLEQTQ